MSTKVNPMKSIPSFAGACVRDFREIYERWRAQGIYEAAWVSLGQTADFDAVHPEEDSRISGPGKFQQSFIRRIRRGNYLSRIFQEKLVRQWFWVLPDPVWKSPYKRHDLWQELQTLYRDRAGPMREPEEKNDHFRTVCWNVETWIGPLAALPQVNAPSLIHTDLDYFSAASVERLPPPKTLRWHLPWIWPETVAARLREKIGLRQMTSIRYVSEAGFAPSIHMRFFGPALLDMLAGGKPGAAYTCLRRVWGLVRDGKFSEARKWLEAETFSGTEEAVRLAWIAESCLEQGEFDRARETYARAVAHDPDYAEPCSGMALLYERSGRYAEAYRELLRMKVFLPAASWIALGEARYFLSRREFRRAAERFTGILEKEPGHLEAQIELAGIYLQFEQLEKAEPYLKRVYETDPRHPTVLAGLARCRMAQRKFEEARKLLKDAERWGGDPAALLALTSEAYWKEGFWALAFQYLGRLIQTQLQRWAIDLGCALRRLTHL